MAMILAGVCLVGLSLLLKRVERTLAAASGNGGLHSSTERCKVTMKTLILSLFLLGAASRSDAYTIHFDELGAAPVNANGVHLGGVLFLYSPGSALFDQNVGTDGTAVLSIDPVLSGPTTGSLGLIFDDPT